MATEINYSVLTDAIKELESVKFILEVKSASNRDIVQKIDFAIAYIKAHKENCNNYYQN